MSLHIIKRIIPTLVVMLAAAPLAAHAAGLTNRANLLGNSAGGATTTHIISATTATGASIGSIKFLYCTTATNACTTPVGLITTGATLTAQSGAVGFTLNNSVNGSPFVTRAAVNLPIATATSYTLSNVTNPTANNQTFYVRITTYTGNDGATGPIDTGAVAVSTAQPIQLSGVTPEILIFCVGTTITSDCTSVSGSAVDFGDFDPLSTKSGSSVMQATTNAANGYTITVNGTTLASGVNTIPGLAVQTASAVGSSQFGLNLRTNTTPAIGTDPAGAGSGTYNANYGTANQYRFNTGDVVAGATVPTNANTYTASYMVNIAGAQAAGVYTSTMTYICTASF